MSEDDREVEREHDVEQELDKLEDLEGIEGALRFQSLDTGDAVLAYAHGTEKGEVALALSHEMDGDLEIFVTPEVAEELALTLARAADEARESAES